MLRVATRRSPLARWQALHVARLIDAQTELVAVETSGDMRRDTAIAAMGGQGVFVKEVQQAVLEGRADLAVHSAKDLPSLTSPGLVLAAVPEREDPRDALVGSDLDGLSPGSVVATGSVRRRAQLAWARPDLTFADLRGNIGTRLEKAASYGAVVVAMAALRRLGRQSSVAQLLDVSAMVPQVGQGALAIECRRDDEVTRSAVAAIEHAPSRSEVDAERAFLSEMGGGCELPVGALARSLAGRTLRLDGLLASLDGRVVLRRSHVGDDPERLGRELARELVDGCGGSFLLGDLSSGAASPGGTP